MKTRLYNGLSGQRANKPRRCLRTPVAFWASCSAFTLIEMLAVIAITSMLLAVSLPAFNGMIRSSSRRAAISQTMGLLDQARSLAIAEGRPTYVVFADSTFPTPDHWYRAAAIFQDAEAAATSPVMLTAWSMLPPGYSFNCNMAPSVFSAKDPTNTRFPVMGETKAIPYIKFGPTGSVMYPNNDPSLARVFLFVGYTSGGTAQIATDPGQRTSITTLTGASEQIKLSLSTGRPKYISGTSVNP